MSPTQSTMPLVLHDIGLQEQATDWVQEVIALDGQALLLLLTILVALYFFRTFVVGFLAFTLKVVAFGGILIFVLQFMPPIEAIRDFPILASLFSSQE